MTNRPIISVIIPAFNRQKMISYCLDSVLAQTYGDLEVIVVDDRSTDNTVSTVRRHPDPRIRCVVLDKRSGAQAARNRGIIEAKSEWIAFQDSDDEWLPDKLERQVTVLADVDYDPWSFIYCNAIRFDPVKGTRRIRLLPVVEGSSQYSTLLRSPAPLFPTIITSKLALEKIGYLDEKVPSFQEWDTSIRLSKYCRFFHLKDPLFVYHVGNNDAISGNKSKHVEGWHYIINKYESDIKELCGEEVWLRLNIQLLGNCLNFGLVDFYDRYRSKIGVSKRCRFQMSYLSFCRRYQIRPINIVYRLTRKIFPVLNCESGRKWKTVNG